MVKYHYYCLAFLDILGQKDCFKENDEYIDTMSFKRKVTEKEFLDKLNSAHRNTVYRVEQIRENFNILTEKFKESSLNRKAPPGVPPEEYKRNMTYNIEFWNIADSILVSTQISELGDKDKALLTNIYNILVSCECIMFSAFLIKKVIRGTIEVGLGTKLKDGSIYGPVTCRAYELESNFADYPRILIGDELINFLNQQLSNQDKYSRLMADLCLKRIKSDTDGLKIHDYAGQSSQEELKGIGYKLEELFTPGIKFAEEERNKFQNIGNQKLANRFGRLYNYLVSSYKS